MLEITVRYFAAAAEAAGADEESWPLSDEATLAEFRAELTTKYGAAMSQVLQTGSLLVAGTVRRDERDGYEANRACWSQSHEVTQAEVRELARDAH
jgi:molybdopterin converting factor small subunit